MIDLANRLSMGIRTSGGGDHLLEVPRAFSDIASKTGEPAALAR
jgi:hypothetical protein